MLSAPRASAAFSRVDKELSRLVFQMLRPSMMPNESFKAAGGYKTLDASEIDLLQALMTYGEAVNKAAIDYEPSFVATYAYDLAKKFHRFYHDVRILSAETQEAKSFRLLLSRQVAEVLKHSMFLIGIEMPERM